jgi:chaperonin GroEL (HSP60 family)
MELSNEADFTRILQLEENYIKEICDNIIALKPDLIFTEKGISDLAQHFLAKAGITGKLFTPRSEFSSANSSYPTSAKDGQPSNCAMLRRHH